MELNLEGLPAQVNNPNFQTYTRPVIIQQPLHTFSHLQEDLMQRVPNIGPRNTGDGSSSSNQKNKKGKGRERDIYGEQEVEMVPAPLRDDDMDIEDDYREKVASYQRDPDRRLPRFTGMYDPVLVNLQSNLETIVDDELRRSVVQATNPYLEFADLLVAAGGEGYKRSDFVYDLAFYNEDVEYRTVDGKIGPKIRKTELLEVTFDKNGKRQEKRRDFDMDLRDHDNNLDTLDGDEYEETDPEVLKLNIEDDSIEDTYILYSADMGTIAENLWLTQLGTEIRQYFESWNKSIKESWARISQKVELYIRTKYDTLTQNMIYGPILRFLYWNGRHGTAGTKLALSTIYKSLPNLFDLVKSEMINIPIQSAIHQGMFQSPMAIGTMYDIVKENHDNNDSQYDQILKQYFDHTFISCFNNIASKHLDASGVPHRLDRALKTPDIHLYHEAAVAHLVSSTNTRLASSIGKASQSSFGQNIGGSSKSFLIGAGEGNDSGLEDRYRTLFGNIGKVLQKSKRKESLQRLRVWQPMQLIMNKIGELIAIQKNDKAGFLDALKLKELASRIIKEFEDAAGGIYDQMILDITSKLSMTEEEKKRLTELRAHTMSLRGREFDAIQAVEKAEREYNTKAALIPPPSVVIRDELYKAFMDKRTESEAIKKEKENTIAEVKRIDDMIKGREDRIEPLKAVIQLKKITLQQEREKFDTGLDALLRDQDRIINEKDPKEFNTLETQLFKKFNEYKDQRINDIETTTTEKYRSRYLRERVSSPLTSLRPDMGTAAETEYIVKMKSKDKVYLSRKKNTNTFFVNFLQNLYSSSCLRNGLAMNKVGDFMVNGIKAALDNPTYRLCRLESLSQAIKILNYADNSFLTVTLEGETQIDSIYLKNNPLDQVDEKMRLKQEQDKAEKRETNRQHWKSELIQKTKFFLHDPDSDARYNYFKHFGEKVLSSADLSLMTVVFKPLAKGAIQTATDDLNLAVRTRYRDTEYNRAFDTSLLMFSPQVNSRFANLVMYIHKGRNVSSSAIAARQMSGFTSNTLIGNVHGNARTRFNMQEDGHFMEGVILFFKDVQYDPSEMRLAYLPNSSGWTPDWRAQDPPTNIRIQTPVLQPYNRRVKNKRQRIDFGY